MKFVVKSIFLFFCVFGGYFGVMSIYFISTPYIINLGKTYPSITSDGYHNFYLSSYENYGVVFQKKLNTSTSLTTPQEVMHFHNHYYPVDNTILVDSFNKKLYIIGGNSSLILMTTSSDWGDTWSPPIALIDFGKITNSAHAMTVDSHGHLAMVYNNESVVFIMNSTDGIAWSTPRKVGSYLAFSIDFDIADNLILLASTDGSGLIYMSSSDYGYSWGSPENITASIDLAGHPLLRIDHYNIFHVWFLNEYSSSSLDLIHERAFNGANWSSKVDIQGSNAHYGFGATLNSVNNSVLVWCEGKTYFFMSFEYFMYAKGLPENYFAGFYMSPFFIGLAIVTGIYWGIFIILYVRMRRNSNIERL